MTEPTMQEILDRVLEALKSGDEVRQLGGLRELGALNFSSEGVVLQLEKLALGGNAQVREAALAALKLKTSRMVMGKISTETRFNRTLFLRAINVWETDGLLEPHRAELLRRRHDFDLQPEEEEEEAAPVAPGAVKPAQPAVTPPAIAHSTPAAPHPSLAQTLLSETSIKIYLYLGAFLVIAAAAILAALVEAARLPILLAATFAFAAGAVGLRKRLPQPSFALAAVFSFLLPIDANVIADSLSLSPVANEIYWTLVFLLMALIWAFGTWFYSSRLFSIAAFISLCLGVLWFGEIFDASTDWNILSASVALLLGLLGVRLLQSWKDGKLARPLFLLAQFFQFVLLCVSLFSIVENKWIGSPPGDWIAPSLTWLLAASFYAASDFLVPSPFFPWMAAASLFLIPWLVPLALDASTRMQIAGHALGGAVATLASEFVYRNGRPAWTKYHFPLLALSLPLFFVSIVWALLEKIEYGFATLLFTGILYTVIHAFRPRWYVWTAALLTGLGAYFTFFALPFMEKADVHATYQLLGASLLLLIPELFFKSGLAFERAWRWPPVLLGTALMGLNLLIGLGGASYAEYDKGAVLAGVYALLFAAYALRFRQPLIGYLAAASAALSTVYALQHFHLDWRLPALTALAVVYYAAGFLLARREGTRSWGAMLIHSGLALGVVLSLLAVFTLEATGGWYAIVIAALFIVEMFTRKNGWLELFAESLLSIALIIILNDFHVAEFAYAFFGLTLLWFACDAVFELTFPSRNAPLAAKIIGGFLAIASVLFIAGELTSSAAALCFGIYALFFAAYARLLKNPSFGYASTTALVLTVLFVMSAAGVDQRLFPLIALASLYYAAGFILRRADKAKGWDAMLLFSGLGLGTFVASLAPFHTGGLENAIPIAVAATFYAAEAFERKNVWLGFPANALYLATYFVILNELNVDEPQFFTVGAAALGLLQHHLLRRAGSKTAAFITGLVSQLVLLGASYIQMVDTGESKYFYLLFFQALAVLGYGGVVIRSRSLTLAPIGFLVLAIVTILYDWLKDLALVYIIGITGLVLLALGILAVVMRERITAWAERFGDWEA